MIPSQGCDVGRRVAWSVESGQASPREVESSVVREAGQIGERPSIKTDQSIGRGTIGMEDARVLGWERR